MNILVLKSSPHVHGSSNLLADSLIKGARKKGHTVETIDVAKASLHPCLACDACGMNGTCVQNDDMHHIQEKLLTCDLAVFVTPLYYFGFSAQMKTMIDRFYSFNAQLSTRHLQTVLVAAAWDANDWTMRELRSHYETLCRYLHFQDRGMVLGVGCGTPSMTAHSPYVRQAYELGLSL